MDFLLNCQLNIIYFIALGEDLNISPPGPLLVFDVCVERFSDYFLRVPVEKRKYFISFIRKL